jgi:hypothetical protein
MSTHTLQSYNAQLKAEIESTHKMKDEYEEMKREVSKLKKEHSIK